MGHQHTVCRVGHGRGLVLGCGLVLGAMALVGCIEPNSGSQIEFDFASSIQTATPRGGTPQPDQPPPDTFYALYAAHLVYELDANGQPVLDENGEPKATQAYVFEVERFEIRKVIDVSSPCFIDIEGSKFPGVHVTEFSHRLRAQIGVDLNDPGAGFDPNLTTNDQTDILNADRRMSLLPRLENTLKAVTRASDFQYGAVSAAGDCPTTGTVIPHPTCNSDESNALRLSLCEAAWASDPTFYEGSDKVFSLPLNGKFFGMVEGMNPVNDGFVGGAGLYVDENLVGYEGYMINWQYKDLNHDGSPDTPTGVTASELGFPYLSGRARHVTRGVTNVTMRNINNRALSAEISIFPNLANDDVNF